MLFWILAGLAVFVVNIYLPAVIFFVQSETLNSHLRTRDNDPEPSVHAARARRSLANMQENLPFFLTFGVLAMIVEGTDMAQAILGAKLFVFARIGYMPMYVFGVPWVRSVVFTIGIVGCWMMVLALF